MKPVWNQPVWHPYRDMVAGSQKPRQQVQHFVANALEVHSLGCYRVTGDVLG